MDILTEVVRHGIENPHRYDGDFLLGKSLCLLLASVELVHGARLEERLLSSVERMTLRACFHTNLRLLGSTSSHKCVATRASDFYLLIRWVNIFFHKRKGLGYIANAEYDCSYSFLMAKEKTIGFLSWFWISITRFFF